MPSGALDLYRSTNYWILSASTVHSSGQERKLDFNLESLSVGQSVGCNVNKDGELRYYIDGVDQGIGWTGVPTDKPLWGFADIYGLARKIRSEFVFGEYLITYTLAPLLVNLEPYDMQVQSIWLIDVLYTYIHTSWNKLVMRNCMKVRFGHYTVARKHK